MFFSLIYFFAPFSIFYIPHNYVILQSMPHAIPQTRSAFYPHRTWYTLISRNWKELATMSCNIIIITILKIFPTKKLKSKCLMYVVMCMLSKVNLKKENISADLVIWIINKQCREIPLTGQVLYFFNHDLSYRLLNALYVCVVSTYRQQGCH